MLSTHVTDITRAIYYLQRVARTLAGAFTALYFSTYTNANILHEL